MNAIVMLLLLALLPLGCNAQQPAGQPEANPNVWPPETRQGDKVEIAKDLLAKNYYVILDSSGSMSESRCADGSTKSVVSKRAFAEFVRVVPPQANLGLLIFDAHGVRQVAPLAVNNRKKILVEVNAVQPGDGTPLRDAIAAGFAALEDQAKAQLGYGEYHLIIVTDGLANRDQDPNALVDRILETTPVMIHTIGFCIDTNHPLNQPGRTNYRTAQDPQELIKGLKAVVAESNTF